MTRLQCVPFSLVKKIKALAAASGMKCSKKRIELTFCRNGQRLYMSMNALLVVAASDRRFE